MSPPINSPRPPRLAEWLLRRCLPVGIVEASIRGDLREEFDSLRRSRSTIVANIWYWFHAVRICVRFTSGRSAVQQRTSRRTRLTESMLRDFRFAARGLRKSPGFSLLAILTLALGIGAATVAFTLVNGILLRPLPYPEAERLVLLEEQLDDGRVLKLSFPNFDDWRNETRTLEGILAVQFPIPATVLGAREPVRGTMLRVSREFFDVLKVEPWLGRSISSDENRVGGEQVAVLGYEFWQRHLGSNTNLEDLSVTLSGATFGVVGVMPPGFKLLEEGDVYTPLEQRAFRVRDSHNYRAIGRLAPGVSISTARAELNSIMSAIRESNPDETRTAQVLVTPLRSVILGDADRPLLMLFGASGLLLIIACSNVASTLLARGTARGSELAIRTAVGASRGRLVSLLLAESVLLAVVAGIIGLGLSQLTLDLVRSMGVDLVPRLQSVSIDKNVVFFALAATLGTSVLFGLIPAMRASLTPGSRATVGARAATRRSSWLGGNFLIAAETALAVLLVVGCGLLVRSMQQLLLEETNIRADGVLAVELDLRGEGGSTDEGRDILLRDIKEELQSLPGVSEVGYVSYLPTIPNMMTGPVFRSPAPVARDPNIPGTPAGWRVVDDDYFKALGIPLLRGRFFTADDRADSPPVVILNQSLAQKVFGEDDPIGELVQFIPFWIGVDLTVVGVVAEARDWRRAAGSQSEAYVYWPQRLGYTRDMTAVLFTTGSPNSLVQPVRERLRTVAPSVPGTIRTMQDHMSESLRERTFTLAVLSSFAIASLLLAAVGIYGVVSYSVSSRAREIGIRLALGADPRRVKTRLFSASMVVIGAGIFAGMLISLLFSRSMESLLYEISATDITTFVAAPAVLLITSSLAIWIPVVRLTRVDAAEVLRIE